MPITHVPLRYAHNEGHTDVCFSEDGQKYISCGSDGDMRIWSQDLHEDPVHNCVGEWALAVRQKGDKVYIATGNNDVQIITFPGGERDGILDRFVAPINNIAVSKNGDLIALAAEEMEVKLIKFDGEQKTNTNLTEPNGPCLSVAICPNSKFVAAAGGDGKLYIWEILNAALVKEISCFPKTNSLTNAKNLCRIDFEPITGNQLAYPDGASVVLLNTSDWSEYATLTCDSVTDSYSIVQFSPCGQYLAASSIKGEFVIWEVSREIVNNCTKHPNNTQVCAFVWNPAGLNQIVYTDVEGQLGLLSDCINKRESSEKTGEIEDNEVDFGDVQFDDDDEDNENAVSLGKLKKQYEDDVESELKSLGPSRSPTPRPRTPEVPLQEPFMPSSTPPHLDPRYLCWNEIGIVRSYGNILDEDDAASKSIEVDFHDATFHSSMMMQNYQNYTMATLSCSVLVVSNSCQINVIPLAFRTKEWTLVMEPTEEIIAIAASEQLVCIGLANYNLRVLSSYGTQRAVFSIPGPIVAMSSYKDDILIAYHCCPVRNGDQCINFKLIRLEGMNIQGQDLGATLGPKSTLSWLGFSDFGTPGVMDSLGMLYLYPLSCNTWIPFCDTSKHRKGMSDGFFVTSITESNQTLCGIKCRGSIYPMIMPRPTMCEVPLEAPFAEMSTEKSQMESSLFTWSTLKIPNTEKKFKETALKTFALACKTNLDQRAQELMEMLANPQILTLGIKYASRLDKKRLAEKLTELATRLVEEQDENEEITVVREEIKPKRLILGSKKTKETTNSNDVYIPTSHTNERSESIEPLSESISTDTSYMDMTTESEDLIFSQKPPKNPFLKSLKNKAVDQNPLSLVDKNAGINAANDKKEVVEKRKQPETESENQKTKQRKLDRFMFGKR